jgi:putative methyltransferase (TIGR04325 family)
MSRLTKLLRRTLRRPRPSTTPRPGPFVDFAGTWTEATLESSGYGTEQILERVLAASLDVEHGRAVHERDSVTFDRIQYAWPVLASLLTSAARHGGSLRVLDLGGSLGSSFRQNRRFLSWLPEVSWAIVEQPTFVAAGREHFENEVLSFHESIPSAAATDPRIALVSSSLQYLDEPHEAISALSRTPVTSIVIDRTPVHDGVDDAITLQHVPPSIYPATYPARILSLQRLHRTFTECGWHLVEEFETLERPMTTSGGLPFHWTGMLWTREAANSDAE